MLLNRDFYWHHSHIQDFWYLLITPLRQFKTLKVSSLFVDFLFLLFFLFLFFNRFFYNFTSNITSISRNSRIFHHKVKCYGSRLNPFQLFVIIMLTEGFRFFFFTCCLLNSFTSPSKSCCEQ